MTPVDYYNPAIGRFTSEDPIGLLGGINYYSFVNNNSMNSKDPFGLINQMMGPWLPQEIQSYKYIKSSFSWQSLKEMICGDKKSCEKNSFWNNVWENFKQTNEFIPGILAPSMSGFITASKFSNFVEGLTLMQWVFNYRFGGAILGGATFTGIETGIIAGMTTLGNWALVSTAFETAGQWGRCLQVCN